MVGALGIMRILAALVFLSVAAGVRPADQVTCSQPILCPCGNTGKYVKVCSEEENPCTRWSKCKICQDGVDGCLECLDGPDGASCSKGTTWPRIRRNSALARQERSANQWRRKRFYPFYSGGHHHYEGGYDQGGCPELNSQKIGSIRCTFEDHRRTCVGKCLPGYTFEGYESETEMTLTCTGNHYTPLREFPPCKSAGHCDLEMQGPGSFNCTRDMTRIKCLVVCTGQYRTHYFCFPGQPWDPPLPSCVRPKAVSVAPEEMRQACKCKFGGRCVGNNQCLCPHGRTGRFCEQIMPERRTCRDPGFVENGLRKNPDGSDSKARLAFDEGESVVYSCVSEQYALKGSSLLTCKNDETWSNPVPKCINTMLQPQQSSVTYCRDPGVDRNGRRDPASLPTFRGFPAGSRVMYSCNAGYELDNDAVRFCYTSGRWSSERPTCIPLSPVTDKPATCVDPGRISNGRVVFHGPERGQRRGPRKVWRSPRGGNVEYPVGGILSYSCDNGYHLQGSDSLRCLENGEWSSGPPVCHREGPDSTEVFCPDPGVDLNGSRRPRAPSNPQGFVSGTRVEYFCNPGYQLEGDKFLFCLSTGDWLTARPRCTTQTTSPAVYCNNPGSIRNGRVTYYPLLDSRRGSDANLDVMAAYPVGGRLKYSCLAKYVLQGDETLTCQPDGTWSANPPVCSDVSSRIIRYCESPNPIENGKVEYVLTLTERKSSSSEELFPEYPQGATLEYSCDTGYILHGASDITCEETGRWSAAPPTCITRDPNHILYCLNPGPILNGKIRSYSRLPGPRMTGSTGLVPEDATEFPESTTLEYECDEGYILEGSKTRTCQSTGLFSGTLPRCNADCGRSMAGATRRILHGNKTFVGEWPWVVAIAVPTGNNNSRIVCGGAVLNTRTVITAAHCVSSGSQYLLYFGKHFRNNMFDDVEVQVARSERVMIHNKYNNVTLDSDIALIKFKPKIKYSTRVQPICLPDGATTGWNLEKNRKGYVTGWGENEKQRDSGELMMAHLPYQTNEDCLESFRINVPNFFPVLTENMFCAGYPEANQSTCRGDSGSPFVFFDPGTQKHTLEGLVSYTADGQCGLSGVYTVYTKVFSFLPWIYRRL